MPVVESSASFMTTKVPKLSIGYSGSNRDKLKIEIEKPNKADHPTAGNVLI